MRINCYDWNHKEMFYQMLLFVAYNIGLNTLKICSKVDEFTKKIGIKNSNHKKL